MGKLGTERSLCAQSVHATILACAQEPLSQSGMGKLTQLLILPTYIFIRDPGVGRSVIIVEQVHCHGHVLHVVVLAFDQLV